MQTVTGERPVFMALPAEHASSHQAWCLLLSMNQLLFLSYERGAQLTGCVLSYLILFGVPGEGEDFESRDSV